MRIEVISGGKPLGRHEFVCQPQPGETIQLESGKFVVDDFCHDIPRGRLQVICTPAASDAKARKQPQTASQT